MSNRKEYEMLFKLKAALDSSYKSSFSTATGTLSSMQKELQGLKSAQSDISAYQKQKDALEANRKKLEEVQAEYKLLQNEERIMGGASNDLTERYKKNEKQFWATSLAIDDNKKKLKETESALTAAGVDTKNLTSENQRLENSYQELKLEQEAMGNFGNPAFSMLNAAKGAAAGFGAAAVSVKTLQELYKQLEQCAEASIEFESAITGVYKTVDGTDTELAQISDDIKRLATVIPATTTELAAVAEAAGQLGIKTGNIMDFTEVMANLGYSTNLSAETAASSLAKFANITQMSADKYGNLGSVIVALGNNFATTESDIVSMATRLAATGELAGLTEAQIMAISTSLSSVGIEAEAGGSAMSKLLKKMQVSAETGNALLNDFSKVAGMTNKEFQQAFKKDAVGALSAFISGLNKTERTGKSAIVMLEEMGLTEVRLSNAILSLANSGDLMTNSLELANQAWEENTALSKEAALRYDTTESKMKILSNAANNLKISIGDYLTPAMGAGAEALTELLIAVDKGIRGPETLSAEFDRLSSSIQDGINVTALYEEYNSLEAAMSNTALSADELATVEANLAAVKKELLEASGGLITATTAEDEAFKNQLKLYEGLNDAMLAEERATLAYNLAKSAKEYGKAILEQVEYEELAAQADKDRYEVFTMSAGSSAEIVENLTDRLEAMYDKGADGFYDTAEGAEILKKELKDISKTFNLVSGENFEFIGVAGAIEAVNKLSLSTAGVKGEVKAATGSWTEYKTAAATASIEQQEYLDSLVEAVKLGAMDAVGIETMLTEAFANTADGAEIVARAMEYVNTALSDTEAAADGAANSIDGLSAAANDESLRLMAERVNEYNTAMSEAYDKAYQAAYTSVSGQISLTSSMNTAMSKDQKTTISDMINNLNSQSAVMNSYGQNLQKAIASGLDSAVVEEFFSTFTESNAQLLNQIAGTPSEIAALNEAFKGAQGSSSALAETMTGVSENFVDAVASMLTEAGIVSEGGALELVNIIANTMKDNGGLLTDADSEIMIAALTESGVLAESDAIKVGEYLTSGMATGVLNEAGTLYDAMRGVIEGAISNAKGVADIHSPSRVTRKEIGQMLGLGAALGVTDEEDTVNKAMRDLIGGAIAPEYSHTEAAAVSAPTLSAAASGEVTISIRNEPTIHVDGNRPGDLEDKLSRNNDELLFMIDEYMRKRDSDGRRSVYD